MMWREATRDRAPRSGESLPGPAGPCSLLSWWCGRQLRRFTENEQASIAVKFALSLPLLFATMGASLDYGFMLREKERLQAASDAAAKAAALEFTLVDTTKTDVTALAQVAVQSMMNANHDAPGGRVQVVGSAQTNPLRVTVDATQEFRGPFGVLGGSAAVISVRSVAQVIGQPNLCVLALAADEAGAIELMTQAQMTGQNCAIYSNSTSTASLRSRNDAMLKANLICSGGGVERTKGNFAPEPITDCPQISDPLAGRAAPAVGACTSTGLVIIGEARTLEPGVYCGGLSITGNAQVIFSPGVHVIKHGPFLVDGNATVTGEGAGFYLVGDGARFQFGPNTTIDLSAPTSGVMAGLLFHESRTQASIAEHVIRSDNARKLLGTIYLPRGDLRIDANKPVADQSAYTAIVANTLRLFSGPNLVLNTNYEQSTVPVPEGIRGLGQPVALVE